MFVCVCVCAWFLCVLQRGKWSLLITWWWPVVSRLCHGRVIRMCHASEPHCTRICVCRMYIYIYIYIFINVNPAEWYRTKKSQTIVIEPSISSNFRVVKWSCILRRSDYGKLRCVVGGMVLTERRTAVGTGILRSEVESHQVAQVRSIIIQ